MRLLASALCALLLPISLAAQSHPSEYVYHVYVDPIYGDNYLAWRLNPIKPPRPNPLPPEWVGPGTNLTFPTNTVQEDIPLQLSYESGSPARLQGHHYHAPIRSRRSPLRSQANSRQGPVRAR